MSAAPTKRELVGHLHPVFHEEVLCAFENKDLEGLKLSLRADDYEAMWIAEASAKLTGSAFAYYFPAFVEYAESSDSEYDSCYPGWLAMSIDLQIERATPIAISLSSDIRKLCIYLRNNLEKFYDENGAWASQTNDLIKSLLVNLDQAEQVAEPDL